MRNPFDSLTTAEARIRKACGAESKPFKCTLINSEAVVFDATLDVAEGDEVVRVLPSGRDEVFVVQEVHFQAGLASIPAHYRLSLKKAASLVTPKGGTAITISNSQGVQIGHHNTQSMVGMFEQLIGAIEESAATLEQKASARQKLKEFLAHPLITALLGGAAGALASKL